MMGAFIYGPPVPVPAVLRTLVNGKDGFVILPQGEDDDELFFEDWETLTGWVRELVGRVVDTDPAGLQTYDDWIDEQ